jgi:hypothetical protein
MRMLRLERSTIELPDALRIGLPHDWDHFYRLYLGGAVALPTSDSVRKLANDINTEINHKRQLYSTLRDMGLEPKD